MPENADYRSRSILDHQETHRDETTDFKKENLDYFHSDPNNATFQTRFTNNLENLHETSYRDIRQAEILAGYTMEERRSIADMATAAFDRGDKLDDYDQEDQKAISDAYAAAFIIHEFTNFTEKRDAAYDISYDTVSKIYGPTEYPAEPPSDPNFQYTKDNQITLEKEDWINHHADQFANILTYDQALKDNNALFAVINEATEAVQTKEWENNLTFSHIKELPLDLQNVATHKYAEAAQMSFHEWKDKNEVNLNDHLPIASINDTTARELTEAIAADRPDLFERTMENLNITMDHMTGATDYIELPNYKSIDPPMEFKSVDDIKTFVDSVNDALSIIDISPEEAKLNHIARQAIAEQVEDLKVGYEVISDAIQDTETSSHIQDFVGHALNIAQGITQMIQHYQPTSNLRLA